MPEAEIKSERAVGICLKLCCLKQNQSWNVQILWK
jgi:hypothetical protein